MGKDGTWHVTLLWALQPNHLR